MASWTVSPVRRFLFGQPGAVTWVGDLGLAIARVSFGLFMAFGHGLGKFPPSQGFVSGVGALGFPAPEFFAWNAAIAEFVGGLLLAVGLLTRPAAIALMFTMGTAAFGAHMWDPLFSMTGPSKEMAMLYLFAAILFATTGPGRFSIDAILAYPRR